MSATAWAQGPGIGGDTSSSSVVIGGGGNGFGAPEINPDLMVAGAVLLIGGALILLGHRRRRHATS